MTTENANYCMLVKRVGMVKVTSLLINAGSGHGFSFGVRAWTEIDISSTSFVHF